VEKKRNCLLNLRQLCLCSTEGTISSSEVAQDAITFFKLMREQIWQAVADKLQSTSIHTYIPRFIPEGAAEASQISLRDAHVLPQLFSYE
jgi:hypothetical protein